MSKQKRYAPTLRRINAAFARLKTLARKGKGKLPSYTWLNTNGYFSDYEVVRAAGLLGKFKRASLK
jgi:hypothetical protein